MNSTKSLTLPKEETAALIDRTVEMIRAATKVQVIGHVRPDGDCIGSLLGMHHILEHYGKEHALAAGDLRGSGLELIEGFDLVCAEPKEGFDADLTIYVDCSDASRAHKNWVPKGHTINIDHHQSNQSFAEVNWVEPGCAAVGEMIYYLIKQAEIALSPPLANALLLAIMTDTGSFQYSNVKTAHFEICRQLLDAGADVVHVAEAAYGNRSQDSVRVMGSILAALQYECEGQVVWGEIRADLIRQLHDHGDLPSDMASELRSIRGVRLSILFTEIEAGGIRVSLRGDGSIDVSKLAEGFDGGGHPNAAGITLESAPYEQTRNKIIKAAQELIQPAS